MQGTAQPIGSSSGRRCPKAQWQNRRERNLNCQFFSYWTTCWATVGLFALQKKMCSHSLSVCLSKEKVHQDWTPWEHLSVPLVLPPLMPPTGTAGWNQDSWLEVIVGSKLKLKKEKKKKRRIWGGFYIQLYSCSVLQSRLLEVKKHNWNNPDGIYFLNDILIAHQEKPSSL